VGEAVLDDPLVRELLAARTVAVLSVLDETDGIHAVPIWFAVGEGHVLLATAAQSRKVRNLARDDRASLVVHDSRPGFEVCGVSFAGRVELVSGPEARPLVELVHFRYVSERSYELHAVREFLAADDVAIRFRADSALIWDQRGTAANQVLRSAGGALPLLPTDPRPL
jgi:hypothetical protein